jgi:hypothetical protein
MKTGELLESKTLIVSAWQRTALDVSAAIELLNRHCKASLADIATGNVMWRGMENVSQQAAVIDTINSSRTSRDTNNLYQLMMDISPHLKEFPSRSKSLICANNEEQASGYLGSTYAVFPFDGVDVCTAKEADLHDTLLTELSTDLYLLNSELARVFAKFGIQPNTADKFTDAQLLDKQLTHANSLMLLLVLADVCRSIVNVEKVVKAYDGPGTFYNILRMPEKQAQIYLDALRKALPGKVSSFGKKLLSEFDAHPDKKFSALSAMLMTPNRLHLNLQKPGSLRLHGESWFSGKCVVIELRIFRRIIEEMRRRGMKVHASLIPGKDS